MPILLLLPVRLSPAEGCYYPCMFLCLLPPPRDIIAPYASLFDRAGKRN